MGYDWISAEIFFVHLLRNSQVNIDRNKDIARVRNNMLQVDYIEVMEGLFYNSHSTHVHI